MSLTPREEAPVDFMVVGAQKGGTTALASFLSQHPQIQMPTEKELHFFDRDTEFAKGIEHYHRQFVEQRNGRIRGDATPSYMYWPGTPERIARYNPDLRVVVILRDPSDRAYSHWNMRVARRQKRGRFAVVIRLEHLNRLRSNPGARRRESFLSRGFYAPQIQRLWDLFGQDQVLLLRNEELRDDHDRTLAKVNRFLGVSEMPVPPARNVFSQTYEPMLAADRRFLVRRYSSSITLLEEMTGWDCSSWKSV